MDSKSTGNTVSSFSQWILVASLSSSVLYLPYESVNQMENKDLKIAQKKDIADWREDVLQIPFLKMNYSETEQINILLNFSKNLVSHSRDLEQEYTDLVSDNFWDLI